MRFFEDDSGIAYGLVYGVIFLAIAIFGWQFIGILMDHLEIAFNSMRYMFSSTMGNRVTDISNMYSYLPIFFIVAFVAFLIVRGLRRDTDFQ